MNRHLAPSDPEALPMRRGRRSHKRLAATERELERREASPQLFDVGPLPAVAAAPGGSLSPREGVPLPQNVTVYPNALTPRRGERDVIVHDDSAPEDEEGEANPLESSVETRDDQEEEKGEEWEGPSPPPASQHAPRDGRSVGSMRWLEEARSPPTAPREPQPHPLETRSRKADPEVPVGRSVGFKPRGGSGASFAPEPQASQEEPPMGVGESPTAAGFSRRLTLF